VRASETPPRRLAPDVTALTAQELADRLGIKIQTIKRLEVVEGIPKGRSKHYWISSPLWRPEASNSLGRQKIALESERKFADEAGVRAVGHPQGDID
jgi:hypothetical protein